MKKTALLTTLLTSFLYAKAGFYAGANYGSVQESFKNYDDQETTLQKIALKVGYGDINAYAIEFSLEQMQTDKEVFSQNDSARYNFNVELLKAFNFKTFFNPYMKAGFGTGQMKMSNKQERLRYGSYNLGGGVFIPLLSHIDLEVGYSYRYYSYEKLDTTNKVYKSHQNSLYTGFNYRF